MAKRLIVLQLILLLANCSKQKGIDNSHSTKNAVEMNPDEVSFVFEEYQPATDEECPQGGWKVVRGRKAGADENLVNLTPSLVSCLEIPIPQSLETSSGDNTESYQVGGATIEDPSLNFQNIGPNPFDSIYSELCTSSDNSSVATHVRRLSAYLKIDCQEFGGAVERMLRSGSLDLTPIAGISEPMPLEVFSPIFDQVENLAFHFGSIVIDSDLEKFTKLSKLNIRGGPSEIDFWNKIPKTVRELQISNSELTTLKGIEALTSLEAIRLPDNKISDIDAVKSLRNLKLINISKNQIQRADSLKHLESLERIDLSDNPLTNYTAVIELSFTRPNLRIVSNIDAIPRKAFFR